jgi:hypothetical protein
LLRAGILTETDYKRDCCTNKPDDREAELPRLEQAAFRFALSESRRTLGKYETSHHPDAKHRSPLASFRDTATEGSRL